MIDLGPDLTAKLLSGYSWLVCHEEYDLTKRMFCIRVLKDIGNTDSKRELCWNGVRAIEIDVAEENIDDNCMDSVVGIQEMLIEGLFRTFIMTEKHGISITSENGVSVRDC